jgi:hypothetical protein
LFQANSLAQEDATTIDYHISGRFQDLGKPGSWKKIIYERSFFFELWNVVVAAPLLSDDCNIM